MYPVPSSIVQFHFQVGPATAESVFASANLHAFASFLAYCIEQAYNDLCLAIILP